MGLTERLARASSRHPWRVLLGWLGAIVLALGLAVTLLPGNLTTNGHVTNNPSRPRRSGSSIATSRPTGAASTS